MDDPSMKSSVSCLVCRENASSGSSSNSIYPASSTWTTASNVSLAQKVQEILGIQATEESLVCQVCFDLIDQLDVFEQNFIGTKQKLRKR